MNTQMDILIAQTRLLWGKADKKYKIHRNVKIKLVATPDQGLNRGFRCGDCGPAVIKAPAQGQIVAILRFPRDKLDEGMDLIMDDIIPHGLAHIVCILRPDIGHGYQHDAGLQEVYNWIKGNA